jgi:hypothetical protein
MVNDIKSKLNGDWMLQKQFQSPWRTILVPLFLDFDGKSGNVLTRSYSDTSISKYSYHFEDGLLKIGGKIISEIIELTDKQLILKIGEDEYRYYKLTANPLVLSSIRLRKELVSSKWLMDGSIVEFTNEQIADNNSFKMIEYRGHNRFFGTYTFDTFKNNLFLILLIDGKPMEMIFKIIGVKDSTLELQMPSGIILNLVKQI